jgi:IS5 family transposase
MLKAIDLQALYDLSDPGLKAALLDRLSFRRFCGFALDEMTPNETTIPRFRADAAAAGVLAACLAEVNRRLENQGVILKKGTLVDATLIRAAPNPPPAAAGLGGPSARAGRRWDAQGRHGVVRLPAAQSAWTRAAASCGARGHFGQDRRERGGRGADDGR